MAGTSWFRKENARFTLAGWVFLAAVATLVLRLGSFGFWDPYEITVADKASKLYEKGGYGQLWKTELPLTEWAAATGVANLGKEELSARLPLALLGIAAALATYALGTRLRRPRAGLFGALVLIASPLFVFQARQLTSDMGAIAGQALAMCGLAGLAWPCGDRRKLLVTVVDVLLVAVGLTLGLFGAGLFLGVFVPLAIAAIAVAAFSGRAGRVDGERPPRGRAFALGYGFAAIAVLAVCARMVFHLEPAQPGARALFGQMLVPTTTYLPWLGGVWRLGEAPVEKSFEFIVTQVAFGMFPWSAIAPVAVLRLAFPRGRDRFAWGGALILVWALVGYLAAALWVRAVGDVRYAALPAIALAVGFFLDDLLGSRLEGDDARLPEASRGLPVAAVFIFLAALILSIDLGQMVFDKALPDSFASLPALGATIRLPRQIFWLVYVLIAFGVATGVASALAVGTPGGDGRFLGFSRAALVRRGVVATLAAGSLCGFYLAHIYMPKLAEHFSQRNVFEAYFQHRRGSEPLGVMGIPGSGPDYYAHGRLERFDTVTQLLEFLKAPDRVFAIVPADKLCTVHQSNTQLQIPYHVVDTRNSRFFLFSNVLNDGEKDLSPLVTSFHKEPPARVDRQVSAVFEDTIELLGADMPDHVAKGDPFTVTLWYRVKKRFAANQTILMHFDSAGSPVRFNGDHQPKSCSTTYWQPGDIISDTHTITAGDLTNPRGPYTFYTGFFTGGGGIWKNMTVTSGDHLPDNRVSVGTIRLD